MNAHVFIACFARRSVVALSALLSATGCVAASPEPEHLSLAAQVAAPSEVLAVGRVSALGTGCRKDTTDVLYTGANKGFTIRFADYALELNAGTSASRIDRDCIVSVEVRSPKGLRYAVTGLKYRGYAALEDGVVARQQVAYSFVGALDEGVPVRKSNQLTGPWDDAFQFADEVRGEDLAWSDCTTERTLLLNTRMTLLNSTPKRQGYLSLSAIDADTSQLEITFDVQPCGPGA